MVYIIATNFSHSKSSVNLNVHWQQLHKRTRKCKRRLKHKGKRKSKPKNKFNHNCGPKHQQIQIWKNSIREYVNPTGNKYKYGKIS